ncbi:MAG: hypothetical protein WCC57_09150 [Paracoccaceae bacterium]
MASKVGGRVVGVLMAIAVFVVSFWISRILDAWVEPYLPVKNLQNATLVDLTHGVALLVAWIFGWLSVPIIALAILLAVFPVWGAAAFHGSVVMLAFAKAAVMPLAFDVFRACGVDPRGAEPHASNWRLLLLVGFVASVLSNQVQYWAECCTDMGPRDVLVSQTASIAGDMLGVFVTLLVAMMAFRWIRDWPAE